eukprot:10365615-Heterocapsa_arctica.AAC.1
MAVRSSKQMGALRGCRAMPLVVGAFFRSHRRRCRLPRRREPVGGVTERLDRLVRRAGPLG